MSCRAAAVFDSSHANAVREAQRAQEAARAAAADAAAAAAEEEAWRLHRQAAEHEARLAAAAERVKRDEAMRYATSAKKVEQALTFTTSKAEACASTSM